MKKVTKEELDYLFSRIDWGKSFLDAKAIDIMNRTDTLFEDEAKEAKGKSYGKELDKANELIEKLYSSGGLPYWEEGLVQDYLHMPKTIKALEK